MSQRLTDTGNSCRMNATVYVQTDQPLKFWEAWDIFIKAVSEEHEVTSYTQGNYYNKPDKKKE